MYRNETQNIHVLHGPKTCFDKTVYSNKTDKLLKLEMNVQIWN